MLRVVVIGLGPIGVACARSVADDATMRLVGLVDTDPSKIGMTLDAFGEPFAENCPAEGNVPDAENVRVAGTLVEALGMGTATPSAPATPGSPGSPGARAAADVAIITTTSRFDRLVPLIDACLSLGLSVVSSCEELAFPTYQHPELARQIDQKAIAAGRVILGTGVNPGFIMDSLAVTLASMVRTITGVKCTRRVNASLRRLPLQKKVGAMMKVSDFQTLAQTGKIGHMGLAESVALVAAGLGRCVPRGAVAVTLEPVVATEPVACSLGLIEPGRVTGMRNTATWEGQGLRVELDLTMAVGLTDPRDTIEVQGPVQFRMKIPGGLPGDSATVAALLNHARLLPGLKPGLRTMLDMPPAGCQTRG